MSVLLLSIINITRYEYLKNMENHFSSEIQIDSQILSHEIKDQFYSLERMNKTFYDEFSIRDYSFGDKNLRILVLDKENHVVFDDRKISFGTKVDVDIINQSKATLETVTKRVRNNEGVHLLYTITPIKRGDEYIGGIFVIKDISSIMEEVNSIGKRMLKVALPIILIFGILIFLYFTNSLIPIEKITEGVHQVTEGKYDYKIEDVASNDLNQIVKSFNVMAERLNEIDVQQSTFISNLSHELKTPITSIKIITETLVNSGSEIDKDMLNELLRDICKETERMKNLIDELLYLASLDKKDLPLNTSRQLISKPIKYAVNSLKAIANKHKVSINYISSENIYAEYDYSKMVQVFLNIIGNAIKYNHKKGFVKITETQDRHNVEIHVIDNGIGIPKKDLKYIFDRFYRASYSRARDDVGGTGLGSTISKDIILLHNGNIEVNSIEGKGTDVKITIPKKFGV